MNRRMTHFLSIDRGKISIRYAGDLENAEPRLFDDEDEAAKALAAKILALPGAKMMTSSSVNWPAEDGRPDFKIEEFWAKINAALAALKVH